MQTGSASSSKNLFEIIARAGAVILVLLLILPTVAPEVFNVIYILTAGVGVFIFLFGNNKDTSNSSIVIFIAGALFFISNILSAVEFANLLPVFYLVPLYISFGFAAVIGRPSLALLALSAAAGCTGGLGVAIYDAFFLGLPEPGQSVNNPIHFAGILVTLSFICLAGLYHPRPLIKVLSIAGGAAGLIAVVIAGARGPLIAVGPMIGAGVFMAIWQPLKPRGRSVFLLCSVVVISCLATLIWQGRILDHIGPFSDAMLLLREGQIVDHSTWERVTMYEAALAAWYGSPVFGHGFSHLVAAAMQYSPSANDMKAYDHLHSDLADFAVGGGTLGLVAYFLILLAPLFAVRWREEGAGPRASRFIAVTICIGYFIMGLTNAMFGILPLTVLYSVVIAVLIAMGRRDDGATGTYSASSTNSSLPSSVSR